MLNIKFKYPQTAYTSETFDTTFKLGDWIKGIETLNPIRISDMGNDTFVRGEGLSERTLEYSLLLGLFNKNQRWVKVTKLQLIKYHLKQYIRHLVQ